ncbi:MAG: DUF4402 domain-containing protein [Pseudomonadota bacterium]
MKNKKMLALGTALVTLSGLAAATRANGATGTGNMSAVIIAALALTNAQTLHFGNISPNGGGTVAVDVTGARTTGGPTLIGGLPAAQQGFLDITSGSAGLSVTVSLVAGAYTVDDVGAGVAMPVGSFSFAFNGVTGASPSATIPTAAITGAGTQDIAVGAVLTVGNPQVAGTYTGDYNVDISYN